MRLEDKWSWRRFSMIAVIFAATLCMIWAAASFRQIPLSDWPFLFLSGLLFCVVLALNMERNRLEKGMLDEKAGNFVRQMVTYVFCCAGTVISAILPDYAAPVLAASAIMSISGTPLTGMITGAYLSILLCMSGSGSVYLLACYLLLSVCGCVVIGYMKNKQNLPWGLGIILAYSFSVTALFSCLEWKTAAGSSFLSAAVNGALSCVLVFFFYRVWYDRIEFKKEYDLEKIIGESYELAQAMQTFSKADYMHARRVSEIAGNCAGLIGADPHIARAAGFYYRLGRLEGEPYVENGVAAAMGHHFPPEIICILGEYNGEKNLPSTLESALVHIVDQVVAKFDVLDQNTLSSSWNQDIVIYQTLNENSAQGLYDKAGLSMNMFLKIRDYLIKEVKLN